MLVGGNYKTFYPNWKLQISCKVIYETDNGDLSVFRTPIPNDKTIVKLMFSDFQSFGEK
jgi:hypothetical protein